MSAYNPSITKFDDLFIHLAQQHGDIQSLLLSFFGFLHRKTDFYCVSNDPSRCKMGFLPGHAEKQVLQAFQNYPFRYLDNDSQNKEWESAKTVSTVNQEQKNKISGDLNPAQKVLKRNPVVQSPTLTKDGKQLPVGNGGSTSKYVWTQTLQDVTIHVDVPLGTKSKDLICDITTEALNIRLRAKNETILEGKLSASIRKNESIWSLEGSQLQLSLEKVVQTWWACVLEGDPEIDTTQVDSTKHIHEYNEETQGAIRKIMFEEKQRRLGLTD